MLITQGKRCCVQALLSSNDQTLLIRVPKEKDGKTAEKKMSSELLQTEVEGYTKSGKLQQVLLGKVQ